MHDLNAKKIKHEQAIRNTKTAESHKPSKWDTPLLILTCLVFITLYIKGV